MESDTISTAICLFVRLSACSRTESFKQFVGGFLRELLRIGRLLADRAAVGTEFLSPYPSYTHGKFCGYPHRIPIPTEPQNPTCPYPHPVFSLQEAYFNLLFITLTVGYYMMYVLCESVCDWSADWLVCTKRLLSWVLILKTIFKW